MAKYSVTASCGHTVWVELIGKTRDREWRLARLREEPCWDCRREAEREQAREQATTEGWPSLEGTPKQVAWAEAIRAQLVERAREFLSDARKWAVRHYSADEIDRGMAPYEALVERLIAQTSARWWIDHRDRSGRGILRDVIPEGWKEAEDISSRVRDHLAIAAGLPGRDPEAIDLLCRHLARVAEIVAEGNDRRWDDVVAGEPSNLSYAARGEFRRFHKRLCELLPPKPEAIPPQERAELIRRALEEVCG